MADPYLELIVRKDKPLSAKELGLLAAIVEETLQRFPDGRGDAWEAFLISKINYQVAAGELPPMFLLEQEIDLLVDYFTKGRK